MKDIPDELKYDEVILYMDNMFRERGVDVPWTISDEVENEGGWDGCREIEHDDFHHNRHNVRKLPSYNEELAELAELAEEGDARVQWMLGERFSRMGRGLEEGIQYLGLASLSGIAPATRRLHKLYDRAMEESFSPRNEMKWKSLFAHAGLIDAQFDYATWLNLNNQFDEGFEWMLKAANAGHVTAQEQVALFYEIADPDEQATSIRKKTPPLETEIRESSESPETIPLLEVFSDDEIYSISSALDIKGDSPRAEDIQTIQTSTAKLRPQDSAKTEAVIEKEALPFREESPINETIAAEVSPYSIIRPSRPYQPFVPTPLPAQPPEIPKPSLIPDNKGPFLRYIGRLPVLLRQIAGK